MVCKYNADFEFHQKDQLSERTNNDPYMEMWSVINEKNHGDVVCEQVIEPLTGKGTHVDASLEKKRQRRLATLRARRKIKRNSVPRKNAKTARCKESERERHEHRKNDRDDCAGRNVQ